MKKTLCYILAAALALSPLFAVGTKAAGVTGDFTGDGKVTSNDAVFLLRHTLFPEVYVLNGFADFTGDGKVTSNDAVYLLRHTLFPEAYPLSGQSAVTDPSKYLTFSEQGDGTYSVSSSDKSAIPESVVIPSEHDGKPVTNIAGRTFSESAAKTVVIPSTVTSISGYAFDGSASLVSVNLPSGLKTVGSCVFRDCVSLTQASVPSGLGLVGDSMFQGCSSLASVTIPSGIKTIGRLAFSGCSSLTEVTLPSGVTKIEMAAFQSCSSMTSITIPASVTSIESSAFNNCKKLKDIYFSGTKARWQAIEKGSSWDYNTGSYTVHCSDGNVKK